MRGVLMAALLAMPAVAPAAEYVAPDYTQDASWLCRPGRSDACGGDIATTSIASNGKATIVKATGNADPGIDCFYVYPTVSTEASGNSGMIVTPAETNVAKVQFAPFRNVCRTFAPMYRQVTLTALRDALQGRPNTADRTMAYRDVAAAWADYLARDNKGRGVILIGHSQGSGVLKALLQNAIEGRPIASQLVAAYIPGHNIAVPTGKDVGGDLKSTPICHSASQTGCVVAWVSFRDGKVPPEDSRFGRTSAPGLEVACANPAALGGGRAPLNAMLPAGSAIVDSTTPVPVWAKGVTVTTEFVSLPGLLTGECQAVDGAHVLSVRTEPNASGARTDHVGGDVVANGRVIEGWGLHLIDVNEVLGDLVTLADKQGKAWLATRH